MKVSETHYGWIGISISITITIVSHFGKEKSFVLALKAYSLFLVAHLRRMFFMALKSYIDGKIWPPIFFLRNKESIYKIVSSFYRLAIRWTKMRFKPNLLVGQKNRKPNQKTHQSSDQYTTKYGFPTAFYSIWNISGINLEIKN